MTPKRAPPRKPPLVCLSLPFRCSHRPGSLCTQVALLEVELGEGVL